MAECSLSLRASSCHVLLWNEHREEFLLLEHREGEVREQARVSTLHTTHYTLHTTHYTLSYRCTVGWLTPIS